MLTSVFLIVISVLPFAYYRFYFERSGNSDTEKRIVLLAAVMMFFGGTSLLIGIPYTSFLGYLLIALAVQFLFWAHRIRTPIFGTDVKDPG